jgi:hypothetical protein
VKVVTKEQLKQCNSQTYLDKNGDSYSYRRDSHKVKQMIEKEREIKQDIHNLLTKEITPIKVTKPQEGENSTNGKANPMSQNHGYSDRYAKRRVADSSKIRKNGRFIKNYIADKESDMRSRSVAAKAQSRSMNNGASSSVSKVVDLKEVRNKEKMKKQARIGVYGTQIDKMFSQTNFSQLSKNYAINV